MKSSRWLLGAALAAVIGLTGCGNEGKEFDINKINPDDYVTLGQYKGIELEKEAVEVTAEEVEESIQSVLEANPIKKEVTERPVQKGDTVTITYEGKIDGEAFENGADTEGTDLTIGSNTFIPGFEDGIIGHKTGETFDLDLTFPKDYKSKELQGKAAVFTVTIKAIKESILPEFTDDFVKSISKDYQTAEEYRKYMEDGLLASKESTSQNTLYNKAWDSVMEASQVKSLPEELVKSKFDNMYASAQQYADSYGVEVKEFITDYMQTTEEEFQKEAQQFAEDAAKESLIVAAIAKAEKLEISEDELNQAVNLYAGSYGQSEEDFKESTDMDAFKEYILNSKVKSFVLENASVKETAKSAGGAEAAKTDGAGDKDAKSGGAENGEEAAGGAQE